MRKPYGFTLAEVLIVLGIIGIIAEMTIPTLINTFQTQRDISKLKKAYSALSQAYIKAVQDNGTPDTWGFVNMFDANTHMIAANNFKTNLRLMADCTGMDSTNTQKNCTKNTNLGNMDTNPATYSYIVTSDGTLMSFRIWAPACDWNWGVKNICGEVITFLNPNANAKMGKDTFTFYITKDSLVPTGAQIDTSFPFSSYCIWNKPGVDAGNFSYQYGCTAWVMYNENMDYLKCTGLNWDGPTKCN